MTFHVSISVSILLLSPPLLQVGLSLHFMHERVEETGDCPSITHSPSSRERRIPLLSDDEVSTLKVASAEEAPLSQAGLSHSHHSQVVEEEKLLHPQLIHNRPTDVHPTKKSNKRERELVERLQFTDCEGAYA